MPDLNFDNEEKNYKYPSGPPRDAVLIKITQSPVGFDLSANESQAINHNSHEQEQKISGEDSKQELLLDLGL